jgi:biotin carboxyl carrier protein
VVEHNPTRNAGYGFSGRMRPEFPSQVIIDVTESCNLACLHCPQEAFRNSDYFSGAMLDPALNAKAVDEVAAAGKGIAQYIRYTAEGEPLLHPQLWEMMRYTAQHAHTSVTLTTNGALLDFIVAAGDVVVTSATGNLQPINQVDVGSELSGIVERVFVDANDRVHKGQVLCIIEAMKLMNEIESDKSGVVKQVLAENGQPVEFGQPLVVIA